MNELEWKVDGELAAHARQDDLHGDGVGNDHTEQVVGVTRFGDGGTGQVGLISNLRKNEPSALAMLVYF